MAPKYVAQTGNGCISEHTHAIDKSGVPKEAQDDALSDGVSGSHQTPPERPTKDDAASMAYLFLAPYFFVKTKSVTSTYVGIPYISRRKTSNIRLN